MDLPPFNPTDLFVEGISVKRLKKHLVYVNNFNFLEPLMEMVPPASNEKGKGDSARPPSDKQTVKVKPGNSVPCTLPKTLKKPPEKSPKAKVTHKKPPKPIDFPRLIDTPETKPVLEKKKTTVIKGTHVQKVEPVITTFPKSNALDWALLQPSKGSGNVTSTNIQYIRSLASVH